MSPNTTPSEELIEYPISTNTQIPFMVGDAMLAALRPKPPRPDQINWPNSQRKNRKNKRRLFAAGGRVEFKK